MHFLTALVALVAAASALPQPASKHDLMTREDFVEDDFEIQAEPDDNTKRSVGWPEVSSLGPERLCTPSVDASISPIVHL